MTLLLRAALCCLAALPLAACVTDGLPSLVAPAARAATVAACAAGRAALTDYAERRSSSPYVQIGAEFGDALLRDSCSSTAIASADATTEKKAKRAARMLKRAKDGKTPDPTDLKAAKAEVAPASLVRAEEGR